MYFLLREKKHKQRTLFHFSPSGTYFNISKEQVYMKEYENMIFYSFFLLFILEMQDSLLFLSWMNKNKGE